MSQRTQESPFRETEWDQRLDRMLDELKSTVTSDGELPSDHQNSSNLSFRSSSRSESRGSRRSIDDGGVLKHHHHEYTSPDSHTRYVADQYEYDSKDASQAGHFQKKVMKSTYSSYNVEGGLTKDLDSLRQGPDPSIMAMASSDYQSSTASGTKVVNASQNVAHKLVDALSTIGEEESQEKSITVGSSSSAAEVPVPPPLGSSGSDTLCSVASNYSTLTRLRKNIRELDSLIDSLDKEEKEKQLLIQKVEQSQQHQSDMNVLTETEELPQRRNLTKSHILQQSTSQRSTESHQLQSQQITSQVKKTACHHSTQAQKYPSLQLKSSETSQPDSTLHSADIIEGERTSQQVKTTKQSQEVQQSKMQSQQTQETVQVQRSNKQTQFNENTKQEQSIHQIEKVNRSQQTDSDMFAVDMQYLGNVKHTYQYADFPQAQHIQQTRSDFIIQQKESSKEMHDTQQIRSSSKIKQMDNINSLQEFVTLDTATELLKTIGKQQFQDNYLAKNTKQTQTEEIFDNTQSSVEMKNARGARQTKSIQVDSTKKTHDTDQTRSSYATHSAQTQFSEQAKSIQHEFSLSTSDAEKIRSIQPSQSVKIQDVEQASGIQKVQSTKSVDIEHSRKIHSSQSLQTQNIEQAKNVQQGVSVKSQDTEQVRSGQPTQSVKIQDTKDISSIHQAQSSTSSQSLQQAVVVSKSEVCQERAEVTSGTSQLGKDKTSSGHIGTPITNGTAHIRGKPGFDEDDIDLDDYKNSEVQKIVWRNKYEKTYEGQDSTPRPPTFTVEEDAIRQRKQRHQVSSTSTTSAVSQPTLLPVVQRGPSSPRQLALQYAVYYPRNSPNTSPGGQGWADPVPIPTPPQVSPRGEPGVAYVYSYGHGGGSQVQHLPPLNYVTLPGPVSVPPSEGAPSPTPSQVHTNQPVIYHYSYHYTLHPGQNLPEGVAHTVGTSGQPPPALQLVSSTSKSSRHTTQPSITSPQSDKATAINYNIYSSSSHSNKTSLNQANTTTTTHHYPGHSARPIQPGSHSSPDFKDLSSPKDANKPGVSRFPVDSTVADPGKEPGPQSKNISITINKTTKTHTTHTASTEYPRGQTDGPVTSTPYPKRSGSRSPSPDLRKHGSGAPGGPHTMYITRTSYSDSLERVRRPQHEGLPFPETAHKPAADGHIPRRVDDLMNSFSDSEDGPHQDFREPVNLSSPDRHTREKEPLINDQSNANILSETALVLKAKEEPKREVSRPVAGPPVYYPPGHQLFHETMHTMSLKESKRRGRAKWRAEKSSGYKESSSHSESKGGVVMAPVCLPLCCGAACTIM